MPTTVRMSPAKIKRALKAAGVTYGAVAERAGVSWQMVWCVINGKKTSANVIAAVDALLSEATPEAGNR